MNLSPHIDYNGQCAQAFRLYEQCLGGRITTLVTYGASPLASTYPELADKVVHASLQVGEQRLTGVDLAPAQYKKPTGFTIQLNLDDVDQARRIYATLSPEGTIKMPLQKTFWAELFAVFTDRFGTPWEINCSGKTQG